MEEIQNYVKSLHELYETYSVYVVSEIDNSKNGYDIIQDSWNSLNEAIETYIRWKGYYSPDMDDREFKKYVIPNVPEVLATEIDTSLRDAMLIKASSLLESSIKETNIIRIQETFPWISDFYEYDNYKSSKKSDYHGLYEDYDKALKDYLPLGKNYNHQRISDALSKVNKDRGKAYEENFINIGMKEVILRHLINSRNKVAHGKSSGLSDAKEYYYMMWYAFENCRLICYSMSSRNNPFKPLFEIDLDDHDAYKTDIYRSKIYS
ncbi:hypothetical protein [Rothia aeria]|uniref:hypothetical protein n=1 Tax=Rothia aeria TaxID=172042 RepID=UPI002889A2FE|nr:hypothetical protein [Rothia aeria]